MIYTTDTFNDVVETSLYASVSLQNYNSDCFSMSDLHRANGAHMLLDFIVTSLIDSGHSPLIIEELFSRFGYILHENEHNLMNLREELSPDFSVDFTDFHSIIETGVYLKENITNFDEFLASNKYR